MPATYGPDNVGWWLMIFGAVFMLIGIGLIAFWKVNIFYLPTGFFVMVLGIGILTLGMSGYSWWDRPPVPKVRCRQCYTLNYESSIHCRKCGANMF